MCCKENNLAPPPPRGVPPSQRKGAAEAAPQTSCPRFSKDTDTDRGTADSIPAGTGNRPPETAVAAAAGPRPGRRHAPDDPSPAETRSRPLQAAPGGRSAFPPMERKPGRNAMLPPSPAPELRRLLRQLPLLRRRQPPRPTEH